MTPLVDPYWTRFLPQSLLSRGKPDPEPMSEDIHDLCFWKLCQPPEHAFAAALDDASCERAVELAMRYAAGAGFKTVRLRGMRIFRVNDPDDFIDDEEMSLYVEQASGITSHWDSIRLDEIVGMLGNLGENLGSQPQNLGAAETEKLGKNLGSGAKKRGPYKKKKMACSACGKEFPSYNAKYDHKRRGKCVASA